MEANFDGIIGPTHNYAGLSWGNVASQTHVGRVSRPRDAALQGLAKMRALSELGVAQGVLPPQARPDVATLRRLGFEGRDSEVIERAAAENPVLLSACSSASSMWAANAATVAPSADTADGRVHFTAANLRATFHRSLEPDATARALRRIFPGERFVHHEPLPGNRQLGDEGAANHTRLRSGDGAAGIHLFVYGRSGFGENERAPRRYPARQTLEASRAVARLHRLDPARTVFAQQNPDVIDEGVFHNDVIAVGNAHVFMWHERAFAEPEALLETLRQASGDALVSIRVPAADVSVQQAVESYLFNSQLVTRPDGAMALIAPTECERSDATRRFIEGMVADGDNPVAEARYLDVRQSMQNGGGPACLRLRVALTEAERKAVHGACLLDETLHGRLVEWVERHYREELRPEDLGDPALLDETRRALDELTALLELGSDFYPFQRA